MKTERRKFVGAGKRRLIVVPETEPYGHDERAASVREPTAPTQPMVRAPAPKHERATVRERAVVVAPEGEVSDTAGRYSFVYGRSSSRKPADR